MTRDEISAVLCGIIVEIVPELEGTTIDPAKTYREMDVDSLDLVSFVTASMQRLNIQIPRNQLASVTSLDALTDLFVTASGGKQPRRA